MRTKVIRGRVKSFDEKTYTAEVVVSDETIDRYNERVTTEAMKKGWKIFKEHPVLLSSHNYGDLRRQIGEFTKMKFGDKESIAFPKYYVGEGNPEADWAWNLVKKGVAAFSIGFIPAPNGTKYYPPEERKAGDPRYEFLDIDLIEISQVLVPANPSALQKQFSANEGEVDPLMAELAEDTLFAFRDDLQALPEVELQIKSALGIKEEVPETKVDPTDTNTPTENKEEVPVNQKEAPGEEEEKIKLMAVRDMECFVYGLAKGEELPTPILIVKESPRVFFDKVSLMFPTEDGWVKDTVDNWVKSHSEVVRFLENEQYFNAVEGIMKNIMSQVLAGIGELKTVVEKMQENLEAFNGDLHEVKNLLCGEEPAPATPPEETTGNKMEDVIGEEKVKEIMALFGKKEDGSEIDMVSFKGMMDEMTSSLSQTFSVQSDRQ